MGEVRQLQNTTSKLFVGGIPTGVSLEDLSTFFNSVGPFKVDIQEFKARCISGRSKGYIIVHGSDKVANQRLLDKGYLYYNDRTLTILPFYSGTELKEMNKNTNQRRVILKRVPTSVTEGELCNLIEQDWGKIQSFFQYSRATKKSTANGKFKSYSMTFCEPQVAAALVSYGSLVLPDGTTAQVIPYDVSYIKGKKTQSIQNTTFFGKAATKNINNQSLNPIWIPEISYLGGNGTSQGIAYNRNNPLRGDSLWEKPEVLPPPTPTYKSGNEQSPQRTLRKDEMRYMVPTVTNAAARKDKGFELHFLKPVSSKYHNAFRENRETQESLAPEQNNNLGNKRFNIATKPYIV